MGTLDSLFISLGGPAEVGRIIGKSTEHAASMRRRGSIPVEYWPALVAAAEEKQIVDLTYEALVAMHVRAKQREATS
ncbi:hypothetical protein [Rhodoplanes roseus]|uniref:Uncharacterized protein n=1 Tax=Rhodoplanes roseus TaxID=29409 RepID=A0A327KV76_9BRAD|nr:hypothetical protein [Rhodoplanes roseus]RAI42800.1 hypothetical protein CH341_17555 [Rhodoplanes roseus]